MVKASLGVILAALMLGGCVYEQRASREYRDDRDNREYRASREVRETALQPPPAPRAIRAPTPITAPQPDRMRADDLSRLSPGTGVAGPEAEPERFTRRTPQPSRLFVQAASFATRDEAERTRRSLAGLGRSGVYTAYVDEQLRYRVRIGPLATPERTERVREAVIRRGYSDAIVVRD